MSRSSSQLVLWKVHLFHPFTRRRRQRVGRHSQSRAGMTSCWTGRKKRKHLKPRSPVTETPNHVAADKPRTKVIQISDNLPARLAAERLVVRSTLAKEAHDCHGMEGPVQAVQALVTSVALVV